MSNIDLDYEVSQEIGGGNVNWGIFYSYKIGQGLRQERQKWRQHLELIQHLNIGVMKRIQKGN